MPDHIHLCLLSAQPVPNLMSILELRPDRIALLETVEMRKSRVRENLLAALALAGEGYNYTDLVEVCELDKPDELIDAAQALHALVERHPGAHWSVNLTGGTKIMAIAAHKVFEPMGAILYYLEIGRPDQIQCLNNGERVSCGRRLSIEQFLRSYGYRAGHAADGALHRHLLPLARAIAQNEDALMIDPSVWTSLRNGKLKAGPGQIRVTNDALHQAFFEEAQRRVDLPGKLGPLTLEKNSLVGRIDKVTGDFLTGGWLETLLYGVLENHAADLELWDLRLNLHIAPVADGAAAQSGFDNELDIAFMHSHALHSIECKSGAQEHDPDVGALYKIEAVLSQLRALLRSAALASTSDNIYSRDSRTGQVLEGQIKPALIERARFNHWTIIDREKIRQMAAAKTEVEEIALLRGCLGIKSAEKESAT